MIQVALVTTKVATKVPTKVPTKSTNENTHRIPHRLPLGISAFNQNEREKFDQRVRLAIGCIEASAAPVKGSDITSDEASIRTRLKSLCQEITSQHADLLELLVKFDDL